MPDEIPMSHVGISGSDSQLWLMSPIYLLRHWEAVETVQVMGSLPLTWETGMNFLALSWLGPIRCEPLRNEPVGEDFLFASSTKGEY